MPTASWSRLTPSRRSCVIVGVCSGHLLATVDVGVVLGRGHACRRARGGRGCGGGRETRDRADASVSRPPSGHRPPEKATTVKCPSTDRTEGGSEPERPGLSGPARPVRRVRCAVRRGMCRRVGRCRVGVRAEEVVEPDREWQVRQCDSGWQRGPGRQRCPGGQCDPGRVLPGAVPTSGSREGMSMILLAASPSESVTLGSTPISSPVRLPVVCTSFDVVASRVSAVA